MNICRESRPGTSRRSWGLWCFWEGGASLPLMPWLSTVMTFWNVPRTGNPYINIWNNRKMTPLSTFFVWFVDGKANLLSILKKYKKWSYCRDETDRMPHSGGPDFVTESRNLITFFTCFQIQPVPRDSFTALMFKCLNVLIYF